MKTVFPKTRIKKYLALAACLLLLAGRLAGAEEITSPATGMVLVKIPAGCFQMGGAEEDNEQPVHQVCLDEFYLGKYEVMQKEWRAVMDSNPSLFMGSGRLPVDNISWEEAREFVRRLNARDNTLHYRLPTEAEWEYAARAGTAHEHYWNDADPGKFAWYDENAGDKTHPVGEKQANAFGLHDMAGNLWEWVADWYGENYYGDSPKKNPQGPETGDTKVLRGGSWFYDDFALRSALRESNRPGTKYNYFGLRVAADPPKPR